MTSAGAAAAGIANAATMATSSNDITAVKARRRILVICISPSLDPVWTTSIPPRVILVNQTDLRWHNVTVAAPRSRSSRSDLDSDVTRMRGYVARR